MHGLRNEYQDRINFVILDFDNGAERELARALGVGRHPSYAVVAPDSGESLSQLFGPLPEPRLRAVLDEAIGGSEG